MDFIATLEVYAPSPAFSSSGFSSSSVALPFINSRTQIRDPGRSMSSTDPFRLVLVSSIGWSMETRTKSGGILFRLMIILVLPKTTIIMMTMRMTKTHIQSISNVLMDSSSLTTTSTTPVIRGTTVSTALTAPSAQIPLPRMTNQPWVFMVAVMTATTAPTTTTTTTAATTSTTITAAATATATTTLTTMTTMTRLSSILRVLQLSHLSN